MENRIAGKLDFSHDVRTGVSLLIPCFNEESSISQLADRLTHLLECYETAIDWKFVFVDDGSLDGTVEEINQVFSTWPDVRILRHETNQGLTAALQTGFRAITTRWVICMDADCTYDPEILPKLLERVETGFDVVSASPYHPQGGVLHVARWRIALSRAASAMYRRLFYSKLTCYTSCVRIYNTRALERVPPLRFPGFVGVTELLWHLDRQGANIGEVPAILKPRTTGVSKMRTLLTARRHLRLMVTICYERLFKSPKNEHAKG